jgi:acetyl esterase
LKDRIEISLPPARDLDAETLVGEFRSAGQSSLRELGVDGARRYLEERSAAGPAGPSVDSTFEESLIVGGNSVLLRIYRSSPATVGPVVVYFHGGGWVIGSVKASDAFCRRLARAADCTVVSVDYPLAPEHPFPAALESAVAAIEWVADRGPELGGDGDRIVVVGDSAGGNIGTAAVGRLVRGGRSIVRRQILSYPGVSADRGASGSPFATEWPLTDGDRIWFLDQYVDDEGMRRDPDVAPLLGDASGLPATTLLLSGCDPLFKEGLAYADHLWSSGVSVDLHVYAGQIHGFLTFDPTILPRSSEALGLVANAVRHS